MEKKEKRDRKKPKTQRAQCLQIDKAIASALSTVVLSEPKWYGGLPEGCPHGVGLAHWSRGLRRA